MSSLTGPIGGARIVGMPKRSRRYHAGRLCSHPDCITRLSSYNRRDTCFAHTGVKFPRLRGRTIHPSFLQGDESSP
ncbi:MAG: hypothetical protein ACRDJF_03310 [Actinomycetota bacterium]